MKKLFYLMLGLIVSLTSCEKESPIDSFSWKDIPYYEIHGKESLQLKNSDTLDVLYVVKNAADFYYKTMVFQDADYINGAIIDTLHREGRGYPFKPEERDTINLVLRRNTNTILIQQTSYEVLEYYILHPYVYEMTDIVFRSEVNGVLDTIAYVPNSVLNELRQNVIDDILSGDTIAAIEHFNSDLYFTPITGEEYRELEQQGLQ